MAAANASSAAEMLEEVVASHRKTLELFREHAHELTAELQQHVTQVLSDLQDRDSKVLLHIQRTAIYKEEANVVFWETYEEIQRRIKSMMNHLQDTERTLLTTLTEMRDKQLHQLEDLSLELEEVHTSIQQQTTRGQSLLNMRIGRDSSQLQVEDFLAKARHFTETKPAEVPQVSTSPAVTAGLQPRLEDFVELWRWLYPITSIVRISKSDLLSLEPGQKHLYGHFLSHGLHWGIQITRTTEGNAIGLAAALYEWEVIRDHFKVAATFTLTARESPEAKKGVLRKLVGDYGIGTKKSGGGKGLLCSHTLSHTWCGVPSSSRSTASGLSDAPHKSESESQNETQTSPQEQQPQSDGKPASRQNSVTGVESDRMGWGVGRAIHERHLFSVEWIDLQLDVHTVDIIPLDGAFDAEGAAHNLAKLRERYLHWEKEATKERPKTQIEYDLEKEGEADDTINRVLSDLGSRSDSALEFARSNSGMDAAGVLKPNGSSEAIQQNAGDEVLSDGIPREISELSNPEQSPPISSQGENGEESRIDEDGGEGGGQVEGEGEDNDAQQARGVVFAEEP